MMMMMMMMVLIENTILNTLIYVDIVEEWSAYGLGQGISAGPRTKHAHGPPRGPQKATR